MRLCCLALLYVFCLPAADLHPYCWGFLNGYPNRAELPADEVQEIQKGHLAHMERMAQMGRLLSAGPLMTPGGPRGLLVYQCDSVREAEEWTSLDPAVVNKRLSVEIYRWNATGRWGEPLGTMRKADPAAKFQMVQLPFALIMKAPGKPRQSDLPEDVKSEHQAYASSLAAQGKLRSYGLFEAAPDKLGVLIYPEMPTEEARKLAEGDPLVTSGWGVAVMHVWYVAEETVPQALPH